MDGLEIQNTSEVILWRLQINVQNSTAVLVPESNGKTARLLLDVVKASTSGDRHTAH
jgi:hypothetical protein